MATPISACFSDGASFTPSPVMATTSPLDCSALTTRTLCSGETRAHTPISSIRSASSSSLISLSWAPVTTLPGMPSSAAMAPAVLAWSPVIMRTPMPASLHSATAATASGRAGSRMPIRVSSVSPSISAARSRVPSAPEADGSASCSPSTFDATASTRRPWPPRASFSACARSRAAASITSGPWAVRCRSHRASTTSGAPFTTSSVPTSPSGCNVAMYLTAESNGTSSRRGASARSSSGSRPTFRAATTRAPSVGSPTSCGVPSSPRRTWASLHRTAAVRAQRRVSSSVAGPDPAAAAPPARVTSPSSP